MALVNFFLVYIAVYICDILRYMPRTAKLFQNGRSQAVRLPMEYRFEGSEVYVRRSLSGDVILSRKPESWDDFFEFMETVNVPENFLSDRNDAPPQKRKLF
jgi:antitoxin VapB